MAAEPTESVQGQPTCSTCGEPIHIDGYGWSHEDPVRIYGHVARKALATTNTEAEDGP